METKELMDKKKLFELLTLVGGVKVSRWDMVTKIVDAMNNGLADATEKEWKDDFKSKFPDSYQLDLRKLDTWSTYEGECIELRFTNESELLTCHAKIYDGDNFNGARKHLRFTAKIQFNNEFIRLLEKPIEHELNCYAEDAYEIHLYEQKKNWITNFKTELLENKF